ncbi:MAG: HNH endonuclease signature motif containing protein [Mycobacteriales bacterium]|nr:HNH endonuclease [Actinomycetota bacterium]
MINTDFDPVYGCELAIGRRDKDGYVFAGERRAHLVAWDRAHGPVADGFELDHTCRRRACCSLDHLELVTRRENELRKRWSHRTRIASCPRGHRLSETAIVTPEGGRVCRTCRDLAVQEQQL